VSRGAEDAGRLVVDPAACTAVGMCMHVAAGVVGSDGWGFPVVPAEDLSGDAARRARRAAAACPRHALRVVPPRS
jgi:ferredoxin